MEMEVEMRREEGKNEDQEWVREESQSETRETITSLQLFIVSLY